jgi:Skp family chaperone for outer membrane proteins
MAEVLDKLSGGDMSDVEIQAVEAPKAGEEKPAETSAAEPPKAGEGKPPQTEPEGEVKTPVKQVAEPPATEPDVDELLKEVEKATAPGGAPAGVIHDLQEERRARQEAEQRATALERDLAEARASRSTVTTKTCSLEEALEKGEITPDDAVTASQQAQWNKNAREREATNRQRTEQETTRSVDVLKTVAATQEEQVSAALSVEKVGFLRSYSAVIGGAGKHLTQEDAIAIAEVIHRGGNGAVECYNRCRKILVTKDPSLKEALYGKPKPGAPVKETTNLKQEKTGEITQETILETSDLQAAEDMFLK